MGREKPCSVFKGKRGASSLRRGKKNTNKSNEVNKKGDRSPTATAGASKQIRPGLALDKIE